MTESIGAGEVLASTACFMTVVACFMRVNHLPRAGSTVEKLLLGSLGVAALFIALTPFFNPYWDLLPAEVIYYLGVGAFSTWLTRKYWLELPGLDRRSHGRRTGVGSAAVERALHDR